MKKYFIFLLAVVYLTIGCNAQNEKTVSRPVNLSDSALLELVQKQTFKYFWDFAHPVSGMARERSNVTETYGNEVITTGGTGFGIMSMIVATERKWIKRDTAAKHLLKIIGFLSDRKSVV